MLLLSIRYLLAVAAATGLKPDTAAVVDAPPLKHFEAAQSEQSAACLAISSKWPGIIMKAEAVYRTHKKSDVEAGRRRLLAWFDAQKPQGCPPWPTALAIQRAMLEEYPDIFDITRAGDTDIAEVAGHSTAQLTEAYYKLSDEACVRASTQMETAWRVHQSEDPATPRNQRRQRFVTNMQTDASVVNRNGRLGGALASNEDFVGLAYTAVLTELKGRLQTLQGQGPYTPARAEDYVRAAVHYAQNNKISHVVFVNVAGGQIPSFAQQVSKVGKKQVLSANYVQYDGWKDGSLATPEQVATFTQDLVQQSVVADKGTLLVVNCNAGMDRSATVNAMAQLVLATQGDIAAGTPVAKAIERGFAAIPKTVWSIKQARPHAISSAGRYVFLYQCYAAYAASLLQKG